MSCTWMTDVLEDGYGSEALELTTAERQWVLEALLDVRDCQPVAVQFLNKQLQAGQGRHPDTMLLMRAVAVVSANAVTPGALLRCRAGLVHTLHE